MVQSRARAGKHRAAQPCPAAAHWPWRRPDEGIPDLG